MAGGRRITDAAMLDVVTMVYGGLVNKHLVAMLQAQGVNAADPEANQKIMDFEYSGHRITNFEMESSALAGLSLLLGHKATTCCMVIANRLAGKANPNYKNSIDSLIELVLERI